MLLPVCRISARSASRGATTFQDYERQPLTEAREDNVSTFSLDTDRTSFQLALNWAREGYKVDPAVGAGGRVGECVRLRLRGAPLPATGSP